MPCVMFSSLFSRDDDLNQRIADCAKNDTIAHIPAGIYSDDKLNMWDRVAYRKFGFRRGFAYPIGTRHDIKKRSALLKCGAIHIGGGNTFELLFMLKLRGLIPELLQWVEDGGILIGNSAGSIVMCPSIRIAGFADTNYMKMTDLSSIGLVDFEMKPHWEGWRRYRGAFEEYRKQVNLPLYCLKEDQAIFIDGKEKTFYGNGKPLML